MNGHQYTLNLSTQSWGIRDRGSEVQVSEKRVLEGRGTNRNPKQYPGIVLRPSPTVTLRPCSSTEPTSVPLPPYRGGEYRWRTEVGRRL